MDPIKKIPYTEIELRWHHPLQGPPQVRARQLRGSLAQCFRDDPLFHQHDPNDGKPLYRYPRIQYRWSEGRGRVAGWGEAAHRLPDLPWLDLELKLGPDPARITEIGLDTRYAGFGIAPRLQRYRFASPALLLNQDNYRRYRQMGATRRREELDRLLVAQILTALRGLEIGYPGRLYAAVCDGRTVPCQYKGQELVGLTGEIHCSAQLPPGFAIGHGVSHGFGWLLAA